MTLEERIREHCLRSDLVYERILSLSCEKDLYILYPSELANGQILKEEKHMNPVTIEQIFETMKPMYIQKHLANGREYERSTKSNE